MFSIAKFMYRFRKWQRLFLPFIPLLILASLFWALIVHNSLSVYGLNENAVPNMTRVTKVRPDPLLVHQAIIDISPNPDELVAADLDNDGDQDFILDGYSVGLGLDHHTLVWLENADPDNLAFLPHTIPVDSLAKDVFAVDVDGNGRIDIITLTNQQLTWHENLGGKPPEFEPHVITDTIASRTAVFAEDIDGNDTVDIAIIEDGSQTLAWYQNDGATTPNFTPHIITNTIYSPVDLFIADTDGDLDMDIVTAAAGNDSFILFENDGSDLPVFTSHVLTDTANGAAGVYVADLDGDTDADIVTTARQDNTVGWYRNDGSNPPNYTYHTITNTLSSPHKLQVADLNNDQKLDLLISAGSSSSDYEIVWFKNDGSLLPNFTPHFVTGTQGIDSRAHAVNINPDDSLNHLVIIQLPPSGTPYNEPIVIAKNDNTLTPDFSSLSTLLDSSEEAHDIYAADLDNDGDIDPIVVARRFGLTWYEQQNKPVPHFIPHPVNTIVGNYHGVSAGDLNDDTYIDIVTTNFDGIIAWHQNDGMKPPDFITHIISDTANQAKFVHVDDLDGDVDLDVIASLQGPNTLLWFENDGEANPTFTTHIISDTITAPRKMHTGDLDKDGDQDIVATSFAISGAMYWFENDGETPPLFTPHLLAPSVREAHGTYIADLDNDQDNDVLYTSTDGYVTWLENNGEKPPQFLPYVIDGMRLERPLFVEAADMDGDGDNDVVVSSWEDHTVIWYENSDMAEPNKFILHLVSDRISNAMDIYPVDVDGDQDLDLLTTSIIYGGSGGNVAWWKNRQESLYIPVVQKQE